MKFVTIALLSLFSITVACQTTQKAPLKVGDIAPELAFKDPNGKTITLTSLRGKLVLIDFWASWCGPCRRENPYVVKAYTEFKDKTFTQGNGFTIYSVSLDNDIAAWKQAISFDNLNWPYHVSDLGGWQSKGAEIYDIRSIPSNFLINDKGEIIDMNLRGEALTNKLKSLLK